MQKQNRIPDKDGRDNSGRTSNQDRKLASGRDSSKRSNPTPDENTQSVKAELKIRSEKPGRR